MEQPPGSLGELQPQDLSTSSIPAGIDLTRKGEECVLNSPSLDALHMVKSPSWYPNPGISNPRLPFSETGSSETTLQSGEPIQPDNTFSHTTVTLSYVSRSHVFSHDSLSRRSSLYGVPPISKLSLHSPCDLDIGLEETGYALNQHYLEQVDGPMDLATQTHLFQSLTQAQVGPENNGGVCLTQEPQELISSGRDMGKHEKGEEDHSLSLKKSGGWEHGAGGSCSSSGVCAELSPETLTSATGEDEKRGSSEALSFTSKKRDPVVVSGSVGARDLSSQGREYISPLEDPVSPSTTSLGNVEDVFVLPHASSSPSGDNSYLETFDEVAWDGLRTEGAIQPGCGVSDRTTRLDSSAENKQSVSRRKAVLEPLIDLTDRVCVSDVSENKPKAVTPHMNGNAKVLKRTLKEKKLPVRPGRGTRLDAIVMNINSSRYKVLGCIPTGKKAKYSQSPAGNSKLASPKRNDTLSAGKRGGRVKAPFSVKTRKQKAVSSMKRGQTNNMNTDGCKDSTSDSEINHSKKSNGSTSPKSPLFSLHKKSKRGPEDVSHPAHEPQTSPVRSKRKPSSPSSPQSDVHENSKEPEHLSHPDPSVESYTARSSLPPSSKSPKKSQGKGKATGSKPSPTSKTKGAGTRKRRQKKRTWSQCPSIFSPKEPEIKLKYVNYKEEKRDYRLDGFSPFIRVEHQQSASSLCTIINYPEEVKTQHKRGQQQQAHPCGFISSVVPSTSCLQLGRASTHSRHQRALVCCLCGQAANAMDLGDLHGPYYPDGYQPDTKRPASMSGHKEDEDSYSDTDSSSGSVRGRGRKSAAPPAPRPLKPAAHLKQKGLESYRWTANNAGSPAAKRARSDGGSADVEDWYSPPVLPLEPCEYWLHEDCSIWSAGVFLVKGKVYGLEEAVKVAEETKCSACNDHGATLGCFFKGCANKYHYRCALESDCVLVEDNFSMKCKKHKNKTFRAPPGNRWEDR